MSQITTLPVRPSSARLGANHGYVIDGDVAQLHADIELLETPPPAGNWALQLWACEEPHTGGQLVGVKVAEAAVSGRLALGESAQRLDAEAHALVPGGRRDYAMVLVLASGDAGHYTQVHDFANYPARQHFVTPHLDGRVGYRIDGEDLVLEADAIRSPRASDNISGSLTLELWAVASPYLGGPVEGHTLGRIDLGRLAGQASLDAVLERVPFSAPPEGNWEIVLVLREWSGPAGYATRDFARFAVRYVVSPVNAPSDREPARVAINRATAQELAAIKGLSRKVAAEIVKGRPYESIDALIAVRGIGPKLLDKLRANVALD